MQDDQMFVHKEMLISQIHYRTTDQKNSINHEVNYCSLPVPFGSANKVTGENLDKDDSNLMFLW